MISRDYIKDGLRARAQDLVTQELGQRNDIEIHRALERQVDAEYWTSLTGNSSATRAAAASSTWRQRRIGSLIRLRP